MYRKGHQGMALLFAAPPSVLLILTTGNPGAGLTFTALAFTVAMLPDTDQRIPFVKHRGITHTIVFAVAVALIGGVLLFQLVQIVLPWRDLPAVLLFGYVASALFVGLLSHLFADSLTVGSGDYAIHPFWPISDREARLGLTTASSTIWNVSLLAAGIAVQIVVYAVVI
jgi:inner membrane protein